MLTKIRKHYYEDKNNTKTQPERPKLSLTNITSLETLKKIKIAYIPYNELLKEGFIAGIGWAFGVTIGFVLVSTILVLVFRTLGGLPLIGSWIADIVQETQIQLLKRTPIIPQ